MKKHTITIIYGTIYLIYAIIIALTMPKEIQVKTLYMIFLTFTPFIIGISAGIKLSEEKKWNQKTISK